MENLNIFYTTCSDIKFARKLSNKLLSDRMANCVNIIKNVESFFLDNSKINSVKEIVLIIKTTKNHKNIEMYLDSIHPYDIPFIGKITVESVNKKYLEWINKNL